MTSTATRLLRQDRPSQTSASTYAGLAPGDPAPWFIQRSTTSPSYVFDTVAGRYIVLCFFRSAGDAIGQSALAFASASRALFDDVRASFFGVSMDVEDESTGRVQPSLPGVRHFWDFDGAVARLYGALPQDGVAGPYRHMWVLLNPALQVLAVLPFQADGSDQVALRGLLAALPPVSHYGGLEMHPPIMIVPGVLEPAMCKHLIETYEAAGGQPSGFMQEVDGKTVCTFRQSHKQRSDYLIEDQSLRTLLQRCVVNKVVPLVRKAHCFEATRMERYIVGCYDAESGGHFAPHRDNTTKGTAHRRFALSVNLNDDFDGGELNFPEYGPRRYKMPAGCGLVFAGALLHCVTPVRRGRRYAFLPFLYDEAAAALRESNNAFLSAELGAYKARH